MLIVQLCLIKCLWKICKFTLSLKSLTQDLLKKPREISPYMLPQGISGHSKPTHNSNPRGTGRLQTFWDWLSCWGLLCSGAKCPAGCQPAAAQPGPCWGSHSAGFQHQPRGWHTSPSANPSEGLSRLEKRANKSHKGQHRKVQSPTWGEQPCPAAQTGDWAAADSFAENSSEPWATPGPCSKETPQCPALHWRSMPAGWGRALFTLLTPPETQLERWVQLWAPQPNTEMGTWESIQLRATKVVKRLENLTDKENLGELGLSLSPGEERAQMISPACVNAWEEEWRMSLTLPVNLGMDKRKRAQVETTEALLKHRNGSS